MVFGGKPQQVNYVISSLVRRRKKLVCGLRLCETFLFLPGREQQGTTGEEFLKGDWLQYGLLCGCSGGLVEDPALPKSHLWVLWDRLGWSLRLRSCQATQPLFAPGRAKHCSCGYSENSLDGGYQPPPLANEGKQWLRTQFYSITSGRGIQLSYCLAYIYFG